MQSNGKSVPAPIFNHRKRPRQAIMSDPQDTPSCGNTNRANIYQDLMPIQGFGNNMKSNVGQEKRSNQNWFNNSMNIGNSNMNNNNNQGNSSRNYSHFSNTKGSNQIEKQVQQSRNGRNINQRGASATVTSAGVGNVSTNRNVSESAPKFPNSNLQNQFRSQSSCSNSSHQTFNQRGNNGNVSHNTHNQWMRNPSGTSRTPATHVNQSYRSPPQKNQLKQNIHNLHRPNRALFESSVDFDSSRSSNFQMSESMQQSAFTGHTQGPLQVNRVKEKVPATKKAKSEVDNTLHVISSPINKIKYWSKFKDSFSMIFEVYGIIDSAVLSDQTGMGKEFVLRDEQASIHCIFYEIDRQLPRLTRGQWHRCVGNFDHHLGKFKCVSVRPVSDGEERRMFKNITSIVESSLRQTTKSLPEP